MQQLRIKWKDLVDNTSGRIMLLLLSSLILISGAFIAYTYHTQLQASRTAEIAKLQSIARSLSTEIDGDLHQEMFLEYPSQNDISTVDSVSFYRDIHKFLARAQAVNIVKSDIYTLVYDEASSNFYFGVTSAETPYYRHKWENYDNAHITHYQSGTSIGPYTDENGVWLSAFAPIKNSVGNTVAIVQVDEPFDSFIAEARQKVLIQLSIILTALICLTLIMLHLVQNILWKEDRLKALLNRQRSEIELKNREVLNSIKRAKNIQDALLPNIDKLKQTFPEMFVMFQPRDIVSGDFFWYSKTKTAVYFAVADCTGHGVPGGFMAMIGHTLLNDIFRTGKNVAPSDVLQKLDLRLSHLLNDNGSSNSDGMDIGILKYTPNSGNIEFAGALRPLILVSDGKIQKIDGDKFSIGGLHTREKRFSNHKIDTRPGDSIYMFSDGYSDQFGGDLNKKYMSKKFNEFIAFVQEHRMEDQQYLFQYEFHLWKSDFDQIDDVLVTGIKIPEAA